MGVSSEFFTYLEVVGKVVILSARPKWLSRLSSCLVRRWRLSVVLVLKGVPLRGGLIPGVRSHIIGIQYSLVLRLVQLLA